MYRPVPSSESDALPYTVAEIYRLADRYAGDLDRLGVRNLSLDQLFALTRSIPYVPDRDLCDASECLQRPALALKGGDCDDKTIFAGAAFNLRGDRWRVKTVSYQPGGSMSHAYPEIFYAGSWRPFDATYQHNQLFTERPYARSLTWEKPAMTTKRNFSDGSTVATLEGSALGASPAFLLAAANLFSKINETLEKLPIIGSLFRGATRHVDFDTAVARQRAIGSEAVKLYNTLDDAGKTLMYNLSRSFFENYILPGWGDSWESFIAHDYAQWRSKGFLKDPPTSVYHWLSMPVFYFLTLEDITRVEESMTAWYTGPVATKVFDPLSGYLENRYGVSLDELSESGSIPAAETAGVTSGKTAALLAIGGFLIFAMTRRGSKR